MQYLLTAELYSAPLYTPRYRDVYNDALCKHTHAVMLKYVSVTLWIYTTETRWISVGWTY